MKNKPSMTAAKVALNIVTLSAKEGMDSVLPPGIVQATEELLRSSGAASERTLRWAKSRRMVSVYEAFDWMLPGQFEAFAHRKAFFERQAIEGIKAGAKQVLVLGAGYDTLGWRLAQEFPDVNFFEVDHPATSRLKAKGISAMVESNNHFLISEDLGQRKLVDVLEAVVSWDRNEQSIIMAEGLLMYLPPDSVRDLLVQCARVSGEGSRVAFSYIPSGEDGRPYVGPWTGLMLWLQKALGEPWIWSILPEELGRFLSETGWAGDPDLAGSTIKHGVEFFVVATKEA